MSRKFLVPVDLGGNKAVNAANGSALTDLAAVGQLPDWLNVVGLYGADRTGSTNATSAIQSALTAAASTGKSVYLPAGTYLLNSSPLTLTSPADGVVICGDGEESTYLTVGASFSGAAALVISGGSGCGVRDLGIQGHSSTYSSNPAAHGIQANHTQNLAVSNVEGSYLNGYTVEVVSDATGDSSCPRLTDVHAFSCAKGIHLLGSASADHLMGAFLVNVLLDSCKAGDGLLIEDVWDVQLVNLDSSANTGAVVHIKGTGGAHTLSGMDLGALSSSAQALLIESGTNGSPSQVTITNSVLQSGALAASVTAGSQLQFGNCFFTEGSTAGLSVTGTADSVLVSNCTFGGNGSSGSGNDLYVSSSGNILIQGCEFTSGSVAQAADFPGSGTYLVNGCWFLGGGTLYNNGPTFRWNNGGDTLSVIPSEIVTTRAVVAGVFALTDASTISVDASRGGTLTVTLGGNRTIAAPTSARDGQKIIFAVAQPASGGPYTVTWASGAGGYEFSTALPAPTLSVTASLTDYVGFIYSSAAGKWRCLAYQLGFS